MAHIGEKFGLGAVGQFSLLLGDDESDLALLTLGDILNRAGLADDIAVSVAMGFPNFQDMTQFSVGTDDAVFDLICLIEIHTFAKFQFFQMPIIGMDDRHEFVIGDVELPDAEYFGHFRRGS